MPYVYAKAYLGMGELVVRSRTMNLADKYDRILNRLWIIASVKQEKTGHLTYGELLEINQLSKPVLSNHLAYLVKNGWLLTKRGVYWLVPDCEEDLKRIDSNLVGYLGYQMKRHGRRAFNRLRRKKLGGFYKYEREIERFETEAGKIGREL
jgi:hypothetical protein